ncbi:MAG: hypothetical protein IKC01_02755 [Clostridia bacterium]|nr:hypothetical protein [Clostridia bacterium]
MEEIIKKFMNKPVILTLIESDTLSNEGEITSYSDGWITFSTKTGEQAINCDYIVKVREKPIKKK